jgi:hypothetical protein
LIASTAESETLTERVDLTPRQIISGDSVVSQEFEALKKYMAPILAIKGTRNVFGAPRKGHFAAIANLPLGLSEDVYGETGQSFWSGADTVANLPIGALREATDCWPDLDDSPDTILPGGDGASSQYVHGLRFVCWVLLAFIKIKTAGAGCNGRSKNCREISVNALGKIDLDHVPFLKMTTEEIKAYCESQGMSYHAAYETYVVPSNAVAYKSLLHFEISVMQTVAKCKRCHNSEKKARNQGSWKADAARADTTNSPEAWLLTQTVIPSPVTRKERCKKRSMFTPPSTVEPLFKKRLMFGPSL